jgi:hypothetical protein
MDHQLRQRHGAIAAAVAAAVAISAGCQASPAPSAATTSTPVSTAVAVSTGAPPTTAAALATVDPADRFSHVSGADLPRNGPIVFYRTDDARSKNTPFEISANGLNERKLREGGVLPGVLSPNVEQIAVFYLVKDPKPTPGRESDWLRPAIVNADGSGWRALDPAPGGKFHLQPIGWSADGSRLILGSGGDAVDPKDAGVFTVRASDGGDLTQVYAAAPGHHEGYTVSPDRSKLLGTTSTTDFDRALFVVNADGSGRVAITDPGLNVADLEFYDGISSDWSPDGSHLVFGAQTAAEPGDPPGLYVERADGTNRHLIVQPEIGAVSAQWSPTGDLIAFTSKLRAGGQVWVVAPDGTGLRQLTDGSDGSTSIVPMWSPDGQALTFQRDLDDQVTLWTMASDGSSQRQLSPTPLAIDFVGGYDWWPAIDR